MDAASRHRKPVAAQSAVLASPQSWCSASRWGAALRPCSTPRRRPSRSGRHGRPRSRHRRPSASTSASLPPTTAPTRMPSSKACSITRSQKLVAASERPDMQYSVTILNSPAVNAFALPTGQLYVTRGLIALANDTSELASVLSHEMSHVIASHAAMREDRGPPASRWSPASSPTWSAIRRSARWRSPNPRSSSRASRARRNSRPTASASASRRAPATTLTAQCAS